MILIGLALALFFVVEWLLTFIVVLQNPVNSWIPQQWLVHLLYWVMIALALAGGVWATMKKN